MISIFFERSRPHRPGERETAEVGQSIGLSLGAFAKSFEDGLVSF